MQDVYKGTQQWIESIPEGSPLNAFEVAARALIVFENRVLLVYEADTDTWFTPGGRLTPQEDLHTACLREIEEETGLACTLGRLLTVSDVIMPRGDHLSRKFEFLFAATPIEAPDFVERDHIDLDPLRPVSKIRWFSVQETAIMPNLFPESLRNWSDLLTC